MRISTDYSIEYAHIYTDKRPGLGQFQSAGIARDLVDAFDDSVSFTTAIMVDDYNPLHDKTTVAEHIKTFQGGPMPVNFWMAESSLAKYADEVLNLSNDKRMVRFYQVYIAKNNKIPCSLLTAIWYLIRLGKINVEADIIHSRNNQSFVPAKRLINILPRVFVKVEAKTVALMVTIAPELSIRNQTHFFDPILVDSYDPMIYPELFT